jgi:hypothetical protein
MRSYPSLRWFAAALFAAAALSPIASWWSLLFSGTTSHLSATDAAVSQLSSTFAATNPERWWFVAWAALPLCLLFAASFYCSPLALRRRWSKVVAAIALVVTLYCLGFVPSLGLFLLVPLGLALWWAYGA